MAMKSHTQRSLLLGFVLSIAGSYCLLLGRWGSFELRIMGSTAGIGAASVLALANLAAYEQRRWRPVGLLGLGIVGAALFGWLACVWQDAWDSETFAKATAITWITAVGVTHTALLALARLNKRYEPVRWGTVLAVGLLVVQSAGMIISEADEEMWWRLMGVLAILAVCGTLTVPILHRVSALRARGDIQTIELKVSLTCPRCGKTQTLPIGRSKCSGCGLGFAIDIEEEHCSKCGYPLYKLQSAVCPECGTPIASSTSPR